MSRSRASPTSYAHLAAEGLAGVTSDGERGEGLPGEGAGGSRLAKVRAAHSAASTRVLEKNRTTCDLRDFPQPLGIRGGRRI